MLCNVGCQTGSGHRYEAIGGRHHGETVGTRQLAREEVGVSVDLSAMLWRQENLQWTRMELRAGLMSKCCVCFTCSLLCGFIKSLYDVYTDLYFTYLEINPLGMC
jgi:hypothetical protein